jgi:hypothetical protein
MERLLFPFLLLLDRARQTARWWGYRRHWNRAVRKSPGLAGCWKAVKRSPDYKPGYFIAESENINAEQLYSSGAYKFRWFGTARDAMDGGDTICRIRLSYLSKRGSNNWLVIDFYVAMPSYQVLGSERNWAYGF